MSLALIDRPWKRMLWIAVLALLAYLPAALQLTYYRDDWYYAYDAMVGPAGVFRFMFAEDRPARGPFFELYHALFGIAPTPYHMAMLFWRIAGGAAVTWLLHLLWPRRHTAGLVAGALFALYPGFTWWVQGIEYQPMVASAALMIVSLCLSVLALRVRQLWSRLLCIAGSILTGWIYLALVEYAAGMEAFRLVLIFFAVEDDKAEGLRSRVIAALRAWLPYLIIPAGFAIWRFAFFAGARKATDLGAQLSGFLADPLSTGLHWLMSFLLSFINVTLAAWVQPLQNSLFGLRLREQVPALAYAAAAGALLWWLLSRAGAPAKRTQLRQDEDWQLASIWLGLAALVLGILPVVAANRQITFPSFSHYALPASLGLALLAVGLVDLLSQRAARIAAYVAMVTLSVLTLQGVGGSALREERTIAAFWHQMAWRAPSFAPATTLLVSYPDVDYGSDSDVVWGPANFIYYPEPQDQLPIRLQIGAISAQQSDLDAFVAGEGEGDSTYRSHTLPVDHGNLLVAAQSSSDACVRILHGPRQMNSAREQLIVRYFEIYSGMDLVWNSGAAPELPSLFGAEPEHGWCYHFEKASLAAQLGEWGEVSNLYDEAGGLGLSPNDQIEWMPFLEAKAQLGEVRGMKEIMSRMNTVDTYGAQACSNLMGMALNGASRGTPLPPESATYIYEQCH